MPTAIQDRAPGGMSTLRAGIEEGAREGAVYTGGSLQRERAEVGDGWGRGRVGAEDTWVSVGRQALGEGSRWGWK